MRFNFSFFIERRVLGIQFISMQHSLDRCDHVYVYIHTRARIIFCFYKVIPRARFPRNRRQWRARSFRVLAFSFQDHDFADIRDDRRCIYSNFTSNTHGLVAIRTRQIFGFRLLTDRIFLSLTFSVSSSLKFRSILMERKKLIECISRAVETKNKKIYIYIYMEKYTYMRYNQGRNERTKRFPRFHFSSLIRNGIYAVRLKNNAVVRVVGQCS